MHAQVLHVRAHVYVFVQGMNICLHSFVHVSVCMHV